MRQTRSPPMELSTSITGTSFEQKSVNLTHLNRLPMVSRSWTVHRVTTPWLAGQRQRDAGEGRGLLPRRAAQRKPFFPIEPLDLLVIHPPPFPAQPHVNSGAPVAPISLSRCSDPRAERLIVWASTGGTAMCSAPAPRTDTGILDSAQSVPPAT
jgi:hypothetical protein